MYVPTEYKKMRGLVFSAEFDDNTSFSKLYDLMLLGADGIILMKEKD